MKNFCLKVIDIWDRHFQEINPDISFDVREDKKSKGLVKLFFADGDFRYVSHLVKEDLSVKYLKWILDNRVSMFRRIKSSRGDYSDD